MAYHTINGSDIVHVIQIINYNYAHETIGGNYDRSDRVHQYQARLRERGRRLRTFLRGCQRQIRRYDRVINSSDVE